MKHGMGEGWVAEAPHLHIEGENAVHIFGSHGIHGFHCIATSTKLAQREVWNVGMCLYV